jgi:hypothetical protein
MKEMKRRLLELEDAWAALDGYTTHAAGCPIVWGQVGPCDCGLTAARTRLREAALQLLTHYAMHDGNALEVREEVYLWARQRPAAVTGSRLTPPPDVTGGSVPPKK